MAYRVILINLSFRKFEATIDIFGKRKKSAERVFNEMIEPMRRTVYRMSDVNLKKTFRSISKQNYQVFLQVASFEKGKKFIKMYDNTLLFLWNIAKSLFESFLYNEFKPLRYYNYIIESYVFYFCVDYIRKFGIEHDDLDIDYNFTNKTIHLIFKSFNEKLHKLHSQKRGDINLYIENELEELRDFIDFEESSSIW